MTERAPANEEALGELLSRPRTATVDALRKCPGDVIVLGAGGKMGPTLARMVARASIEAEIPRKVYAVSRFPDDALRRSLVQHGVEAIRADLLDASAVAKLPDAPNVIFMAGQKFGTSEAPSRTWMMNVVVPAHCAERYASSRIVAFSTGNVYPLMNVLGGGATESTKPYPVGEYAASCLGRERVFEYYAEQRGTRVAIMRLNYAIDLRYGVLSDLAVRVASGSLVPVGMGYVNLIWQGDANRAAIEMLPHASAPPFVLNVTGADTLSVRTLATELSNRLDKAPHFDGTESPDALLSDSRKYRDLLGDPEVGVEQMLDWTAEWVRSGGSLLNKPTHFETRDGAF